MAAGAPLHKTFVWNTLVLQLLLYRVGWWSTSIVTSPYFATFSISTTQLAQWASGFERGLHPALP